MPNWLGDAVMAAPAIQAVRTLFPEATIGLAIKENVAGFGRLLPAVDKIHPLPSPSAARRLAIKEIFRENYQLLVIFPNSFRSAWELRGGGIGERIGYSGLVRSLLLTHSLARPPKHSVHQRDYFFALVKERFPQLQMTGVDMALPKGAAEASVALLPERGRPLAGIGFGATYGSAKMWPADRFAAVIDRLAPHADVVLLGAESDRDVERRVSELVNHKPISLIGKTDIPTLAATLKRLSVYITNDTGPMHLAAALGTPVVSIFGPTDPHETAPLDSAVMVLRQKADCAPCWKRHCPIDHRCMTAIGVEDVAAAALEFMNSR